MRCGATAMRTCAVASALRPTVTGARCWPRCWPSVVERNEPRLARHRRPDGLGRARVLAGRPGVSGQPPAGPFQPGPPSRVPYPYRAVGTGADREPGIQTDPDPPDGAGVTVQRFADGIALAVPQPQCRVRAAAGGEPPVRADRDAVHPVRVAVQRFAE